MICDNHTEDLEARIVETATRLFIEKGYAETSMSDIAARAGINRPTLHYYFRTKDWLFEHVFGIIVSKIAPKVISIIPNRTLSVEERTSLIVDAYFSVLKEYPNLPAFIMREADRDISLLMKNIEQMGLTDNITEVLNSLKDEMESGLLKKVPCEIPFLTLYSQMVFPFSVKKLMTCVFHKNEAAFEALLAEWKKHIVRQMVCLLDPAY